MFGQNGRQELREADAAQRLAKEHFGEKLDSLRGDFQRAQACRAKAEKYRNEWFAGQRRTVADALADPTLEGKSYGERVATGESRWSLSTAAKDLAGVEQMYWRWMQGYLDFYRADPRLARNSPPEVTLIPRSAMG